MKVERYIATSSKDSIRVPLPYETEHREVFHYTSPEGLLGIVSSDSIWASSPLALNDLSEVTYGVDLLKEVVSERPHTEALSVVTARLEANALSGVRDVVYFLSASKDWDLLNQWQGYTSRRGYAIGIDTTTPLVQLIPDSDPEPQMAIYLGVRPAWYDVEYNIDTQRKLLSDLLDFFEELYAKTEAPEKAGENFASLFAVLLTQFKHPAFEDEREVRYIVGAMPGVAEHFRAGPYGVVPYVELGASARNLPLWDRRGSGKLPINTLVCGPVNGDEREMARAAAHRLMAANGYSAEIRVSEAPYRY